MSATVFAAEEALSLRDSRVEGCDEDIVMGIKRDGVSGKDD